ncbi:hypothetical protein T492DRAFT_479474 [Pavlovales sp. CCMP2436]|nr:hypothetical protein T492DRAFT_479474 [Pavlovales sp. CCMP2436]
MCVCMYIYIIYMWVCKLPRCPLSPWSLPLDSARAASESTAQLALTTVAAAGRAARAGPPGRPLFPPYLLFPSFLFPPFLFPPFLALLADRSRALWCGDPWGGAGGEERQGALRQRRGGRRVLRPGRGGARASRSGRPTIYQNFICIDISACFPV